MLPLVKGKPICIRPSQVYLSFHRHMQSEWHFEYWPSDMQYAVSNEIDYRCLFIHNFYFFLNTSLDTSSFSFASNRTLLTSHYASITFLHYKFLRLLVILSIKT